MKKGNNKMGYSILLAGSSSFDKNIIRGMLLKMASDIRIADSMSGTIDLCSDNNFDLMLLDLDREQNVALEALRVIRMSEPDMPILALTESPDSRLRYEALQTGVNILLEKPLDLSELMSAIDASLGM